MQFNFILNELGPNTLKINSNQAQFTHKNMICFGVISNYKDIKITKT